MCIRDSSEGVPRIVVQLVDRAMLMGMKFEKSMLDAYEIELAWADLQQLPEPKSPEQLEQAATNPTSATSSIEFGLLSD